MSAVVEPLLLLRAARLERRARRAAQPVGIALVYHRVAGSSGSPEHELAPAIGRDLFRRELLYLRRRYAPVAPSSFTEAVAVRRPGDRLPVALTFDDDTRSHLDEAGPALTSLGLTGGFFLGGWSLAGSRPWWETLQLAVDHARLEPAADPLSGAAVEAALRREPGAIRRLGEAIELLDPRARADLGAALAECTADLPGDPGLGGAALDALAGSHEVGFHTRAHDRLPGLTDAELDAALRLGRAELEEAIGRSVDAIAYPHGRADARVAAAARAAGYSLGFSGLNRAASAANDRLLVPRVSPSHRSLGVFALTLARATLLR